MEASILSYSLASVTAQSRLPGPVPLPMANILPTRAALARPIASERSRSKSVTSRWACESMNIQNIIPSAVPGKPCPFPAAGSLGLYPLSVPEVFDYDRQHGNEYDEQYNFFKIVSNP